MVLGFALVMAMGSGPWADSDISDRVTHGYADSNGVKIHYVSLGEGPLVVMIHGFPDYWYTWRHQMDALADQYRVVAIDQRGYNKSDQPKGQENYDMKFLVADVAAVIKDVGEDKAVIVGHDWGGAVAWQFAMNLPDMCERLIILNLPHPKGISRELTHNEEQIKNSAYARRFKQPDAHKILTAKGLTFWVKDTDARKKYVEAFERSDLEAMLHYYKQNYPDEPYTEDAMPSAPVKMPVLMFHGLKDTALHSDGLNNTWDWLDKDLTLVTIPDSGHFVQQDAADLVSRSMKMWLNR